MVSALRYVGIGAWPGVTRERERADTMLQIVQQPIITDQEHVEWDQMSVTIASWWHLDAKREINPKCSIFPLSGAGKIISHVISHAEEWLSDYLPNFQQIKPY